MMAGVLKLAHQLQHRLAYDGGSLAVSKRSRGVARVMLTPPRLRSLSPHRRSPAPFGTSHRAAGLDDGPRRGFPVCSDLYAFETESITKRSTATKNLPGP